MAPRVDEPRRHRLVLGPRVERRRHPRRRPARPDLGPVAGVTGVGPGEVRRAGRQRQQHRQPGPDPVHDVDRLVPVGEPDVRLRPADQLLAGQLLVVVEHPVEPGRVGDLLDPEVGDRRGAGRDDPQTAFTGQLGQPLPPGPQLGAELDEVGAHVRGVLDQGLVELGLELPVPASTISAPRGTSAVVAASTRKNSSSTPMVSSPLVAIGPVWGPRCFGPVNFRSSRCAWPGPGACPRAWRRRGRRGSRGPRRSGRPTAPAARASPRPTGPGRPTARRRRRS